MGSGVMDDGQRAVVVRPPAASARVEVGAVTVLMKSNLWISWARIAITHEREAHLARAHLEDAFAASGDAEGLRAEMEAGLVTVVAVYFAFDALHADIAPLVGRSLDARAGRGRAWGYMLDTFRHATGRAGRWQRDLEWLVVLRDDAVHFRGELREPVPHPSLPTHVAAQVGDFSSEACTQAVDFLMRVFGDLLQDPDDELASAVREWATAHAHVIDDLEALRGPRAGGLVRP